MKISPKAKKIIFISSGSILAIAVFVWYFFPVLMADYFLRYRSDVLFQYVKLKPIPIIALKAPPKEWKDITIDNLTMKLPMSKYTKVCGIENFIRFISGKGCLVVANIVPSKEILQMVKNKLTCPAVSFRDYLAIFSSTPADVSFFNSRTKIRLRYPIRFLKP